MPRIIQTSDPKLVFLSEFLYKIEEKDTQKAALQAILKAFPIDEKLVFPFFTLIERRKTVQRSSARHSFLIILAALCQWHPKTMSKHIDRIVSYTIFRLKHKQSLVTNACNALMTSVVMHSFPQNNSNEETYRRFFITSLTMPILSQLTSLEEHATLCLKKIILPIDFDPSENLLLKAHLTRIAAVFPTLMTIFIQQTFSKPERLRMYFFQLLEAGIILIYKQKTQFPEENDHLFDVFETHMQSLVEVFNDSIRSSHSHWKVRLQTITLIRALFSISDVDEKVQKLLENHMQTLKDCMPIIRFDNNSIVRKAANAFIDRFFPADTERIATKSFDFSHFIREQRKRRTEPELVDDSLSFDVSEGDYSVPSDSLTLSEAVRENEFDFAFRIVLLSNDSKQFFELLRQFEICSEEIVETLRETTFNAICAAILECLTAKRKNRKDLPLLLLHMERFVKCKKLMMRLDKRIYRAIKRQLLQQSIELDETALWSARILHFWERSKKK